MDPIVLKLLLFFPVFILSLSIHEWAHAWAANRLGDGTARFLGRLTLNPVAHASLIGTLIFPAISIISGGLLFGWAKPVPVDMSNFKDPRKGMAVVASAGPASNFILAIFCAAVLSLVYRNALSAGVGNLTMPAIQMLQLGVQLNLFLCFFNLLPIQPLDGSRIVNAFVKQETADFLDRHAMQAQILLLVLLFSGALRILIMPVFGIQRFLYELFGLPVTIF